MASQKNDEFPNDPIGELLAQAEGTRQRGRKQGKAASPLHERIEAAAGEMTYRHLAEITYQHPETVRRYVSGQAPSAEFLQNLCRALRLNGDWLLTGRGPMKSDEIRAHALSEANTPELFSAMAGTVESLVQRVERLEVYTQSLEVKLRSVQSDTRKRTGHDDDADREAADQAGSGGHAAVGSGSDRGSRASAVGRAVAKRSPEAAGGSHEADGD